MIVGLERVYVFARDLGYLLVWHLVVISQVEGKPLLRGQLQECLLEQDCCGIGIYSGFVFEVKIEGEKDYGSVLGGGHYDDLLSEVGGPELPGVGFAVGLERLVSSYMDEGLDRDDDPGLDVYLMPIGTEAFERSFGLLVETRLSGYSAEMPTKEGKLGAYFKKAERAGARYALIYGDEELEAGKAQLKDLRKKEQVEIDLTKLAEELDARLGELGEEEEHHHAE